MIGVPMPDPRQAVIADLHRQMDAFFGAGGQVHQIEPGVSAEVPGISMGASGHAERLRAERNKLAPMLKALAETGITSSAAATQTRIRQKRVELIAKENGFKFA